MPEKSQNKYVISEDGVDFTPPNLAKERVEEVDFKPESRALPDGLDGEVPKEG